MLRRQDDAARDVGPRPRSRRGSGRGIRESVLRHQVSECVRTCVRVVRCGFVFGVLGILAPRLCFVEHLSPLRVQGVRGAHYVLHWARPTSRAFVEPYVGGVSPGRGHERGRVRTCHVAYVCTAVRPEVVSQGGAPVSMCTYVVERAS